MLPVRSGIEKLQKECVSNEPACKSLICEVTNCERYELRGIRVTYTMLYESAFTVYISYSSLARSVTARLSSAAMPTTGRVGF